MCVHLRGKSAQGRYKTSLMAEPGAGPVFISFTGKLDVLSPSALLASLATHTKQANGWVDPSANYIIALIYAIQTFSGHL